MHKSKHKNATTNIESLFAFIGRDAILNIMNFKEFSTVYVF